MKLTIIESTTGIHRNFSGGSEDMSVGYFIGKVSEMYQYDSKRMKILYNSTILNKMPDQSLSSFGIKSGDTVFVINFQNNNSFVTHLNHLHERHKSGALKV